MRFKFKIKSKPSDTHQAQRQHSRVLVRLDEDGRQSRQYTTRGWAMDRNSKKEAEQIEGDCGVMRPLKQLRVESFAIIIATTNQHCREKIIIVHTLRKEAPSVENKQRHRAAAGAPSPFHCANLPAAARDTRPARWWLCTAPLSTFPSVAIELVRGNSSICLCLLCFVRHNRHQAQQKN